MLPEAAGGGQHFQAGGAKFEVLLQKQFLSVVPFKIPSSLFYRKLHCRKQGNSLSVLHRNSSKYSNDQRGKLD